MSDLKETSPTQAAANPTVKGTAAAPRRRRVPMSTPTRRLEVPELPGYRLYWFRESNVPRALQAGYDFVHKDDVKLLNLPIASHPGGDGNTDLGTNVSIVAGTTEHGQPERAVLMKIVLEYFQEDQKEIAVRNAKQLESIFAGEAMAAQDGQINERGQLVYVDKARTSFSGSSKALLNRPIRKARIGR